MSDGKEMRGLHHPAIRHRSSLHLTHMYFPVDVLQSLPGCTQRMNTLVCKTLFKTLLDDCHYSKTLVQLPVQMIPNNDLGGEKEVTSIAETLYISPHQASWAKLKGFSSYPVFK